VLLSILSAVALLANAQSGHGNDTLILNNGDRLTGTVLGTTGENVRFKPLYGGRVKFPLTRVREIRGPNFTVLRKNGATFNGPAVIQFGNDVGTAIFSAPTNMLHWSEVMVINPGTREDQKGWRHSGRLNVSSVYKRGNAQKDDIDVDGRLELRNVDNRVTVSSDYNREEVDGRETKNKLLAEGRYDHFVRKRIYGSAGATYKSDEFADLDERTTWGVGVGYQPYEGPDTTLHGELSLIRVREEFSGGGSEYYNGIALNCDFEQSLFSNVITFYAEGTGAVKIDDTGTYFLISKVGVRVPLWAGFIGSAETKIEHESEPASEAESTDYTYRLKFGYEW